MELDLTQSQKEFLLAEQELGTERFNKHLRNVFDIQCLDFVKTIVFNLPEPCYANCDYCIDNYLRCNSINNAEFLQICEKVLGEFPTVKSVSITGGSLNAEDFYTLVHLIKQYLPEARISWNTNGAGINEDYFDAISMIERINLHRNAVEDRENDRIFRNTRPILSIPDAKRLMGEKLFVRVTIDENFDIDEYLQLGAPLYLNRLLPGTDESNRIFNETIKKLNISDNIDKRRRNIYLSADYKGVPVRICVGDKVATHVPNRKPTYLNVAIVHRSGVVCGSWFEDDKVIYTPKKLREEKENSKDNKPYILTKSFSSKES